MANNNTVEKFIVKTGYDFIIPDFEGWFLSLIDRAYRYTNTLKFFEIIKVEYTNVDSININYRFIEDVSTVEKTDLEKLFYDLVNKIYLLHQLEEKYSKRKERI